jgi:tetratricopeptide (TPR) repeat protein
MNTKKLINKAEKSIAIGDFKLAINILDKLIESEPEKMRFRMLRSEAYLRSELFEKALPDLAEVVGVDNTNIGALNNFAVALLKCRKFNEAKDIFEYLIELEPTHLDSRINLCNVYQALGAPEKALQYAFSAIEIDLTSAAAFNNLGAAFGNMGMHDEARESYITALQLNSKYIPAIINLAEVEAKFKNYEESIVLFENALTIKELSNNDKNLIKYYLSYSYLATGRIEQGWINYEFGFNSLLPKGAMRSDRRFEQPRWNGDLKSKSKILIWSEQGLGDEILFSTCIHQLHDSNLNIILECDLRMVSLYKRTFPKFTVREPLLNFDSSSLSSDFDLQIPFGSLPSLFRNNLIQFPKVVRSIEIDPSVNLRIQGLLKVLTGKKLLGICWRSGKLSYERNSQYSSILDWGLIFSKYQDYHFINLQYGECEIEIQQAEAKFGVEIHRWHDLDLKNDLEAVFALISNLDLVVTVGTAVSMIAGAVNVETHLIMKQSWVLLGQKEKHPWFPSIKPYIIQQRGHVGELLKYVADKI